MKTFVLLALAAVTSVGCASSATPQDTGDMPVAVSQNEPLTPSGPDDSRRWDGLALRNSGIVILKSRWDPGALEFRESSLRWIDSKRTEKNLLIPFVQITEQQLTCLKKSGGNECFEWVVMTRNEDYRFRDVSWKQGENEKILDIFDFFREDYPNLISSRAPVDEK